MATEPPAPEIPEPVTSAAAAPAPAVRALSCPACGGTIELRAAGYTVTVACIYCGSLLDVANPDVRLIAEFHQAAEALEIPLGTRGVLRGVEWEVIGYLRKSEGGDYPWEEYLLFNPYRGYRWLISNGRGWNFAETLTRTPVWGHGSVMLDDALYQPFFADGTSQVDYVLGEFYWRVQAGEQVATDDFVRPGFMLSREANEQEVAWSLSEWLEPREIEQAFGVTAPRKPWPPLPHQPSPYGRSLKSIGMMALGAVGLLLLLALLFGGNDSLLSGTVPLHLDGRARTATLGPVTVSRPYQIVSVQARAPNLENAWVDLEYALVDRATQTSYEAYGLAERYSGRDADGNWNEGSRAATVKLAAVPAGSYDLVVDYTGNRWGSSSSASPSYSSYDFVTGKDGSGGEGGGDEAGSIQLEVRRGAVFRSNLIIAILLLLVPLIFIFNRHLSFEKARQGESDYDPTGVAAMFQQSDDEEEED
ncbi:MAG: DUF4178 domain-containing protein [Allosphingosinicella sp.]